MHEEIPVGRAPTSSMGEQYLFWPMRRRVSQIPYIGPSRFDGRWHDKGATIIYCAATMEGAILEMLLSTESPLTRVSEGMDKDPFVRSHFKTLQR